jgi:hypothetical protein
MGAADYIRFLSPAKAGQLRHSVPASSLAYRNSFFFYLVE